MERKPLVGRLRRLYLVFRSYYKAHKEGSLFWRYAEKKVATDNNDDDAERKTIEMTMEDIKTTPTTRVQQKKVYCTTNKDNKSWGGEEAILFASGSSLLGFDCLSDTLLRETTDY